MIPFYLVTGFLGSGKTTLLKRILERYASEKRIAVIQNEFAPSGTDGAELVMGGNDFKLVEINNGSVFCVCMLGNFITSLARVVHTYQPDMIFLEASGLSDPINILELLDSEQVRDRVALKEIITIVDAVNFERAIAMLPRTRHQVMIADTVLINKSDCYDGDLDEMIHLVGEINPFAEVVRSSHCNINMDFIAEARGHEHRGATVFGKKESEGRPEIRASVLKTNQKISMIGLEEFINSMMGQSVRIKGFVNTTEGKTLLIQVVFGVLEMVETDSYSGPSEIIAFGEGLAPKMLKERFNALSE